MSQTISICPLDGRYREATEDIRQAWGDSHLMRYRVYLEVSCSGGSLCCTAYGNGGWECKFNTDPLAGNLEPLYEVRDEDLARISAIEKETNHDLKAVEYYVKERLRALPSFSAFIEFVHILCTSEDINNLAYGLMAQDTIKKALVPNMQILTAELQRLATEHAEAPLLARTHGQPATPTTFGKEFAIYCHRLTNHMNKVRNLKPCGKFNGAVGNFNAHIVAFPDKNWAELAQKFVESLGLAYQPLSTQIECHDWVSEFCDDVARFNTTLLGFCVDCWTYISRDLLALRRVECEVGSSTMPHKINPIDFENAEGNLGIANAMLRFFSGKLPISRLQRDLSDTTCLRSLGCALGYSLLGLKSCIKGLGKTAISAAAARTELAGHWEVLAEPIQTVMRREGEANAYEQLKQLTRGQQVNSEDIQEFISNSSLPEADKERLKALTPETYIGLASQLAKNVV